MVHKSKANMQEEENPLSQAKLAPNLLLHVVPSHLRRIPFVHVTVIKSQTSQLQTYYELCPHNNKIEKRGETILSHMYVHKYVASSLSNLNKR